MSRDKQIEEMAIITCQMYRREQEKKCAGVQECDMKCLHYQRCEALYNLGYRKASDVALGAVDNFQSRLRNIFCTMCCDNDYNTVCLLEIDSAIESLFDVFIAELKKKYTEERK